MATTQLHFEDLRLLFQGKVIYRSESGAPADPPAGDTTTGRHAIEIAINPSDLQSLRQMITPKFWEPPFVGHPTGGSGDSAI